VFSKRDTNDGAGCSGAEDAGAADAAAAGEAEAEAKGEARLAIYRCLLLGERAKETAPLQI